MTCPACIEKRLHTLDDWQYHPYAGHGFAQGQGWTHPDLAGATLEPISGEVAKATAPAGNEP